jgi:hypothetical protein
MSFDNLSSVVIVVIFISIILSACCVCCIGHMCIVHKIAVTQAANAPTNVGVNVIQVARAPQAKSHPLETVIVQMPNDELYVATR